MVEDSKLAAVSLKAFPDDSIALIQGGARGIGLAFVEQLLMCNKIDQVFATCRDPANATRLKTLKAAHPNRLEILSLNITQESDIVSAAETVANTSKTLHLLINCAGLLHNTNMQPEKKLADVTPDAVMHSFQVNALGPLLLAKHFQTLFPRQTHSVFASLSARVGSITDNRLGGWYAYRGSKAAQNMFTRNIALEFQRRRYATVCVALHPGTVDTSLSKPFQRSVPENKLFSTNYAANRLLHVIDNLTLVDTGGFFAWDGQSIPW